MAAINSTSLSPASASGNPVMNSIGPKCSKLLIEKVQNAIYDHLTGNSIISIIRPEQIKIHSITPPGPIMTIEYSIQTDDLSGLFTEQHQTISTTNLGNQKDKEKLKKLIKTLGKHVSDIKEIEESTVPQQRSELQSSEKSSTSAPGLEISAASSSEPVTTVSKHKLSQAQAEKLAMFFTILAVIADITGVIRNVLGLLCDIGPLVDTVSKAGHALSLAASTISTVIAAFRIFQGVCSLVSGIKNLVAAVQEYREAKANNDTAGMEIAKYRIKSAVVNICIGLFWITIGIVSLACPQVALIVTVITILQWILFYGLFSADSFISILSANKKLSYIDKHRSYFEDYIFKNNQLSTDQKKSATANWLKRTFQVPETDQVKKTDSVEIKKIKTAKLARKTAKLARILGIDHNRLNAIIVSKNQLEAVKKCFISTRGEQKASRFLAIFCLAINFSSLQLDGPKAISLFGGPDLSNMATAGLGTGPFWVGNDFWWTVINTLYGAEDGPGLFTKFFQRERKAKLPKGDSAASRELSPEKPSGEPSEASASPFGQISPKKPSEEPSDASASSEQNNVKLQC